MTKKIFLLVSLMCLCIACSDATVESQADAPPLTSEFVLAKEQVYENSAHGFALDYPADWVLFEDSFINMLDPSEDDFKASSSSAIDRNPFTFIVTNPYVGIESEVYQILPSSSAVVAEEILATFGEFEILEPIISVDINGRDGATFLVERPQNRHQYVIILRITEDTSIDLGALGPANRSEEMQDVLNAIALNFRPIDDN